MSRMHREEYFYLRSREYAHIDKDVYVIGNGEKAEIWSKEEWDGPENMSDNQASMDELADELDALDFSFRREW